MPLDQEIGAIIEGAIERHVFPGAVVLIARDSAICHYEAYGSTMYDALDSQPAERTTIYDIASLTKVFTATAALRLLDEGRLDLYAPVASYLPELRAPGIAVIHLLTHTSGLDIRLSTLRHAKREDMLAAVYGAAAIRPPGQAVAYTNVNSLLLGEIVARLHGAPLDEVIAALVIEPLGLRDTTFRPHAALLPRIAPTEVDEDWRGGLVHGQVHDESAYALGGVAGHAGLFSTAFDLFTFCRMWLDDNLAERDKQGPVCANRILSTQTIALARTNHTVGLALGCGLGWMIDRPNFMGATPLGTIGHTGFTGPAIVIVPGERLIVVVLNNRIYPHRRPPEHHSIIGAVVSAALRWS